MVFRGLFQLTGVSVQRGFLLWFLNVHNGTSGALLSPVRHHNVYTLVEQADLSCSCGHLALHAKFLDGRCCTDASFPVDAEHLFDWGLVGA